MSVINKGDTRIDTQLAVLLDSNVDVAPMLHDLRDMATNPEPISVGGFVTLELIDDQVIARARLVNNTFLVDAIIPVEWHFSHIDNKAVLLLVLHYNYDGILKTAIKIESPDALQELQRLVSQLQADTLDVLYKRKPSEGIFVETLQDIARQLDIQRKRINIDRLGYIRA